MCHWAVHASVQPRGLSKTHSPSLTADFTSGTVNDCDKDGKLVPELGCVIKGTGPFASTAAL